MIQKEQNMYRRSKNREIPQNTVGLPQKIIHFCVAQKDSRRPTIFL